MSDPFAEFGNLTVSGGAKQPAQQGSDQQPAVQPYTPEQVPQEQPKQPVMNTFGQQQQPTQPVMNTFGAQQQPPMQQGAMQTYGGPVDDPWGLVAKPYQAPYQSPYQAPVAAAAAPNQAMAPAPAGAAPVPGAIVPASAPTSAPPPAPAGLPPGWQEYTDPTTGRPYYVHMVSGTTSWDKPSAPPAAAPPPQPAAPPASPPAAAPQAMDPFFDPVNADPFASGPQPAAVSPETAAFPGFGDRPPSPVGPQVTEESKDDDNFWAEMGFGLTAADVGSAVDLGTAAEADKPSEDFKAKAQRRKSQVRASVMNVPDQAIAAMAEDNTGADRLKGDLPSGKEYDAEIPEHSTRLGVVFQTAEKAKRHMYSKISPEVIKALGTRPVVAYMANDAGAHKAGVHMGDIVLKVNGHTATSPKEAQRLVARTFPKQVILTVLKPDLPIIIGENQHFVKYDSMKSRAPTQVSAWKPKYVVVGGIIGQPYMMHMYTTKFEYDMAVSARLAGRHPHVKIKTFDLRGARMLIERETVTYPGYGQQWHFFVIQPAWYADDMPSPTIKISHPMREGLIPIYEAVTRILNHPQYKTHPDRRFGRTGVHPTQGGGARYY